MRTTLLVPLVLVSACTATGTDRSSPASPPAPAAPSVASSGPVAPATFDPAFAPLRGLLGRWQGSDPDRRSTGEFTLAPDLGGKVLVRRNHNDSPQGRHEDLMIVFATPGGLRASYFDNEGHVIQYTVSASVDRIELVSDEVPGQPRFRLRYEQHGTNELAIDFSAAMPGASDFQHYTGGVVQRVGS